MSRQAISTTTATATTSASVVTSCSTQLGASCSKLATPSCSHAFAAAEDIAAAVFAASITIIAAVFTAAVGSCSQSKVPGAARKQHVGASVGTFCSTRSGESGSTPATPSCSHDEASSTGAPASSNSAVGRSGMRHVTSSATKPTRVGTETAV